MNHCFCKRVLSVGAAMVSILLVTATGYAGSQWFDSGTGTGIEPSSGSTGGLSWANSPGGSAMWANTSSGTNAPLLWGSGNEANFTAGGTVTATVDGATASSVIFSTAGGTYYFMPGSGSLTVNGGITNNINSGSGHYFYNDIILGANQTWYQNGSSAFVVTGAIRGASYVLTLKSGSTGLILTNSANNALAGFTLDGGVFNTWGNGNELGGASSTLTLGSPTQTALAEFNYQSLPGVTSRTIGDVVVAGVAQLGLDRNSTASTTNTLNSASLSRSGRGALVIVRGSGLSYSNQVNWLISGSVPMVNGMLPPWVADSGIPGWVTYNNGIQGVTYDTGAWDGTKKIDLSTATNLAGSATVYALRSSDNVTVGTGLVLSNASGGFVFRTTGKGIIGGGILALGSPELVAYVDSITAIIGTQIQGCTGGVTLFGKSGGTGMLVLSNLTYSGDTVVHVGTVNMAPLTDTAWPYTIRGVGSFAKGGSNNLSLTGTNTIGFAANTVSGGGTLTIGGGVTTNTIAASLFSTSGANTFVITNGGRFVTLGGVTLNGSAATNNVLIGGDGSILEGIGVPQLTLNNYSRLLVTGSGVITNLGLLRVSDGNSFTSVVITNGSQISATSADLKGGTLCNVYIGGTNAAGVPARLNLTTGGFSHNTYSCISNTVMVDADGVLTAAGGVSIGYTWSTPVGRYNRLMVNNGGAVSVNGSGNMGRSPDNLIWVGGSNPATGMSSLFDWNGKIFEIGQGSDTNNRVVVDAGGVMTNAAIIVGDSTTGGGINYPFNSWLIVSNGGRYYGSVIVGNRSSSNTFALVGSNTYFSGNGTSNLNCGAAMGNTMIIDGALATNVNVFMVGYVQQAIAYGIGNSGVITNGGRVYSKGVGYVGDTESYANLVASDNSVLVTGLGSLWDLAGADLRVGYLNNAPNYATNNTLTVEANAVVSNVGVVNVGYAALNSTNVRSRLSITSGGMLQATSVKVGQGAGSVNGSSVMVSGGLLETTNLTVSGNNAMTNTSGVFQFTSANPAVVTNGGGSILVNSGVISFRNVTNGNVKCNWSASQLTNMTFTGVNAFRLNNSTNNIATNQTYAFGASLGATNYAGLEMVSGNTAYTNGSVTVAADGWLTFSNTTAIMWGPVTNNGMMRIVDSSVTFKSGLVLGDTAQILYSSNNVGNTITVNGTLKLYPGTALTLQPPPDKNATFTLFQADDIDTTSGSSTSWNVTPSYFRVARSGNALVLRPRALGFVFIVE